MRWLGIVMWLLCVQASASSQIVAGPTTVVFYPESISSLWGSTQENVQLTGRISVVSVVDDTNGKPIIAFMLGDGKGHNIRCVLPHDEPQLGSTPYVDQPRVGLEVTVFGRRRVAAVAERGQGVVEIDPVARIVPVER